VQAKCSLLLLTVPMAFVLLTARASGQVSNAPDLDIQANLVGSTLTCSQIPHAIRVPPSLVERAKLKARLANLLRDSLYDDTKGIVNIAREKEIKRLANKLRREE
jgi:hypothetical protein